MKAVTRYIRISPKKLALIADLVRGMPAQEAVEFLAVTPKKAAKFVNKAISSAIANAENNYNQDPEGLVVKEIIVTKGPMLKRGRPVSRGRYHRIVKRTSHLSIELSSKVN